MNGLPTLREEMSQNNLDNNDCKHIMKLFLLLYADDSVIFAEKPDELQLGLIKANEYCRKWDPKLNPQKCKVVIFLWVKLESFPIL